MCTFKNEKTVVVCDLAIHRVREALTAAFGDAIEITPVEGQGTRVEARSSVDQAAFQAVARAVIAAAQKNDAT